MAGVMQVADPATESNRSRFLGSNRNFVPAVAMFTSGILAFSMGGPVGGIIFLVLLGAGQMLWWVAEDAWKARGSR